MSGLGALLGLAWTQRREVTRQPVYGVGLAVGAALVGMAPALAVFALGRAEALVLDLGASTALFFGAFLAAAAVAAGTAERLADGTTTLVLTKPVGPLHVVAGGFLGAALALLEAGVVLGAALLLAVRNGPDGLRRWAALPAAAAVLLSLLWGVRASLMRRAFQPAAQHAALVLLPVAWLVSLGVGPPPPPGVPWGTAAAAAALATLASVAFAALGIALGTRLPPAGAAALTLVAFVLASLVQAAGDDATTAVVVAGVGLAAAGWGWLVLVAFHAGPGWGLATLLVLPGAAFAAAHRDRALAPALVMLAGGLLAGVGKALGGATVLALLVPDLQLYWVGDAAYTGRDVPWSYVAEVGGATLAYCAGALGLGALALSTRELAT